MTIIDIITLVILAYVFIGLIFGLWFIIKGAQRLDEGMQEAKWGMRLILLPASIGLWPVLIANFKKMNK